MTDRPPIEPGAEDALRAGLDALADRRSPAPPSLAAVRRATAEPAEPADLRTVAPARSSGLRARSTLLVAVAAAVALVGVAVHQATKRDDRGPSFAAPRRDAPVSSGSTTTAAPPSGHGALAPRRNPFVVDHGATIVVGGGSSPKGGACLHDLAAYDGASWSPLPAVDNTCSLGATWADGRVAVLGTKASAVTLQVLDLSSRSWLAVPQPPAPLKGGQVVWTGREIVVASTTTLAAFDPTASTWRLASALATGTVHDPLWTGTDVLAHVDAGGALSIAAWSPAADAWRTLPAPPTAIAAKPAERLAWVQDRLVAYGGGVDAGGCAADRQLAAYTDAEGWSAPFPRLGTTCVAVAAATDGGLVLAGGASPDGAFPLEAEVVGLDSVRRIDPVPGRPGGAPSADAPRATYIGLSADGKSVVGSTVDVTTGEWSALPPARW